MKAASLLSFALIVSALFLGCKKDAPVSDSLAGTWELRIDVNGLSGRATYHKTGNDTLAIFTDNTYAFYQKNNLVKSGTYQIKRDTFSLDHTLKNRIIYDHQDQGTIRNFFDIQNNQLSFFIDAYDAPSVTYQRLK
jgi:hypothetical protein